jgi:hypothetical protein
LFSSTGKVAQCSDSHEELTFAEYLLGKALTCIISFENYIWDKYLLLSCLEHSTYDRDYFFERNYFTKIIIATSSTALYALIKKKKPWLRNKLKEHNIVL